MTAIKANGITIEYEEIGPPDAPAILLIMGLGMQLIAWPQPFCEGLAARGFRVVRFDNRDAGLSTRMPPVGALASTAMMARAFLGLPVRSPYTLDDMARDTVGLMDALGIGQAHVVGASMGGMIAQIVAIEHPERVKSLTSIMSTSGDRALPGPKGNVRRALLRPRPRNEVAAVDRTMEMLRLIGGGHYPLTEAELRARVERSVGALPEKPLTAGLPVSVRPPGNAQLNNQVLFTLSRVPTDIAEPLPRLAAAQTAGQEAKNLFADMRDLVTTDVSILGAPLFVMGLTRLWAGVRGANYLSPAFNVAISNVPGPRQTMYCVGAPATHYFPVSIPYHGCALNITVQSYLDQLDFGLVACSETVPDTQRIADFLVEDFAAMCKANAQLSEPGAVGAISVERRTATSGVADKRSANPDAPKVETGSALSRNIEALGATTEALLRQLDGARSPAVAGTGARGLKPTPNARKVASVRLTPKRTARKAATSLSTLVSRAILRSPPPAGGRAGSGDGAREDAPTALGTKAVAGERRRATSRPRTYPRSCVAAA
jgi:pimeloyl-ACP methyl ester carboxylesterase